MRWHRLPSQKTCQISAVKDYVDTKLVVAPLVSLACRLEPESPADREGVVETQPVDIVSPLRCGPGLFDFASSRPMFRLCWAAGLGAWNCKCSKTNHLRRLL